MHIVLQILIQLTVLVVAMVIASLILRWIMANPEKLRAAWRRTKRRMTTPFIWVKAFRSYSNWKKVKMPFTFQECLNKEWEKYERKQHPDQPYYRL